MHSLCVDVVARALGIFHVFCSACGVHCKSSLQFVAQECRCLSSDNRVLSRAQKCPVTIGKRFVTIHVRGDFQAIKLSSCHVFAALVHLICFVLCESGLLRFVVKFTKA